MLLFLVGLLVLVQYWFTTYCFWGGFYWFVLFVFCSHMRFTYRNRFLFLDTVLVVGSFFRWDYHCGWWWLLLIDWFVYYCVFCTGCLLYEVYVWEDIFCCRNFFIHKKFIPNVDRFCFLIFYEISYGNVLGTIS